LSSALFEQEKTEETEKTEMNKFLHLRSGAQLPLWLGFLGGAAAPPYLFINSH
jgi:hypothetical protein